jgi:5'(3')-deoxyribonucleotidase
MNTLYIDFDDTLCMSTKAIVSLYNEDFQYYKNFHHINWCDVDTWEYEELNCTSKNYILEYFNQKRFFDILEFQPEAKHYINLLSEDYDIKIVSMCSYPNYIGKRLWLEKNLPGVELIFVDQNEYPDKAHIDMSDGIFIDDLSTNLKTSNAKTKVCFGTHSWNKDWHRVRCNTWEEIYKLFDIAKETKSE